MPRKTGSIVEYMSMESIVAIPCEVPNDYRLIGLSTTGTACSCESHVDASTNRSAPLHASIPTEKSSQAGQPSTFGDLLTADGDEVGFTAAPDATPDYSKQHSLRAPVTQLRR